MFLVKFRATEKEQWSPLRLTSYIFEEYVDTNNKDYAEMRAYQEMIKELEEDINNYKIDLIKSEELNIIR